MSATGTRVVFHCEACGGALRKRSSFRSHQFLRHDLWQCTNPLCSASYVGFSELTSLASPSGLPDAPPSELPPTPVCLRRMAEAAWRGARADGQQELFESSEGAAPGVPAWSRRERPCNR